MEDTIPEGPEVRKITEGLAAAISGQTLISTDIISGRYTKKEPSDWEVLKNKLPLKVVGAGVHGKFCYWLCSDEIFIYSTLGMTGSWNDHEKSHPRITFSFSSGKKVYFNDQRNFGTIKVVVGKQNLINKLRSLGPDLLAQDVPDQVFIEKIRKKPKWGITKALMDQSVVAGVGNYIKSESLWLAKIDPHRKVASITDGELAMLNRSIKSVMRESYQHNGSTVSAYQSFSIDESLVGQQQYLVYSKQVDPNGLTVVKDQTDDKRATYWVPEVQK
tara:strand:- start:7726 stop:8547 length:822 start_codon:yes stop_codon:yes gene_type:complete